MLSIIKFIDQIIIDAIDEKASDIHFIQKENTLSIQFRINGFLINKEYEKSNIDEVFSRIKIMAGMNISEKRLPQDGKYTFKYKSIKYDLRIATLPGEAIVIRILKTTLEDLTLKGLGFSVKDCQNIIKMLSKKYGLILVSGATGSGKSITLLSFLLDEKFSEKRIITIEDPIENVVDKDNILQVEVNENIGLSFDCILRASLRMDPDIIIISEIRDEITAKTAIRASLTGHLVIATIHSSDIISTIFRLIDMNIPKYILADSLVGIVNQRLEYNNILKSRKLVANTLLFDENIQEILNTTTTKKEFYEKYHSL